MVQESIKTTKAKVSLIEDKIILFEVDARADFGLKEMLEVREANKRLAEGNDYCVVMEAGELVTFSKETKEASASPEHTKNRIALALIQHNMAMKLITDLYLKINKPVGLTKVFNNREAAIKWLREMRDKHYEKS